MGLGRFCLRAAHHPPPVQPSGQGWGSRQSPLPAVSAFPWAPARSLRESNSMLPVLMAPSAVRAEWLLGVLRTPGRGDEGSAQLAMSATTLTPDKVTF